MRQLIVTTFLSLDGVMEDPGWTFTAVEFDESAYELKGREQEAPGAALLLGRVSYDEFAPVWHTMDEFESYNQGEKYVVSTTLEGDSAPWGDYPAVTVLRSLDDVAHLKETDGGPLLVHGSATLAQSLAAAGLVDRYHLLVFPILLGSGKRLFGEGEQQQLRLTESQTYGNGVTMAVYDVVK
jgi:dihydrofolate reductase